jgi:hypothetical protein
MRGTLASSTLTFNPSLIHLIGTVHLLVSVREMSRNLVLGSSEETPTHSVERTRCSLSSDMILTASNISKQKLFV